jgi:lysozyme
MSVIEITSELVREFEGLRLKPYLCPAGVPTIGYGTTRYPDSTPVTLQDIEITEKMAEKYMQHELQKCHKTALIYCPDLEQESENRQAAITDFVYNLGASRLASSTLKNKINDGKMSEVPAQLRRWVYAGSKKLPGLVKRREAECALWVKN